MAKEVYMMNCDRCHTPTRALVVLGKRHRADGTILSIWQVCNKCCKELDDERKAAMVSNLLVVLCGNKEAQPVVNSGSLY